MQWVYLVHCRFMTHYCNDQVGVLLTQQECEMVTDPKQAKHKCKPNSFSL